MKTPSYETTAIIGGTNQSTKVDALPPVINVRQSGRLRIICLDENSFEYDITSLTGTDCKAKPYGTSEVEVTLGTGTVKYTPEIFTLTSPATPPTSGNFTLTVAGETTAVISYNATASDVLSALEALPSRSAGDFEVQQTAGLNLSEAGASVRVTLSGGFQLTARSTYTAGTIDNDIVLATVRTQSTLQNMYEVIWVKDKIPAGWATYPEALGTGSGTIVIWVELEETGTEDFYSISERFNIEAGDYSQSGDITPEVNLIWYYNPTYEYDNVTTDADPTSGKFRTNNTTLASATEIYISDNNKSNVDLSSYFQALVTGSRIYFGNPNVVLESAMFEVSGSPVNNTNYTTIPVTFISSGTPAFTTGSFFSLTIDAQSASIQNNFSATTDPTATDDSSAGYVVGSKWVNTTTDEAYICLDATATSAVWTNTTLDVSELATVAVSGDSDDLTEGATNLLLTSAERTKIGHLTVTQAVDLDTLETDVTANNVKVTNATHTGDVTGSGALTLAPVAVSGQTTETAVTGDFLLFSDTSDSGNLKKVDAGDFLGSGATDLDGLTDVTITSVAQGDILYRNATEWVNLGAGTSGQFLQTQGAGANPQWSSPSGSGDVVGPASATDNAVARFDSTTGKLIQNSGVYIDDSNNVTGAGNIGLSGGLNDANGNEIIKTTQTASAVNEITVTNNTTTNAPIISATGDDTNISLVINAKGTGNISLGDMTFDADQTIGAGQDNYVLTYDNGTGLISLEASAGGGGTDANAIHDNVAGEITAITAETALDLDDTIILESSANSDAKRSETLRVGRQDVQNTQTGTTYTLVLADGGKTVTMSNASANTLTIPTNASVAFPTNTVIAVMQYGAGSTTVAGDTGVTVNGVSAGSVEIGEQYSGLVLTKTATDTWVATVGATGDVTGPASSTDNGLVTFDSTTGKLIQDNTGVTVSDSGAFNGVESLTLDEISTPSTPSSGKHVSYFDADNDMVMLDDTGDERFHQGTALKPDSNFVYILNPRGAALRAAGDNTGAIKITTPLTSFDNSLIEIDLKITDYTGAITELHKIGGYIRSAGSDFVSERAITIAGQSRRVRFGTDGTNLCFTIGETTDTWNNPHISVINLTVSKGSISLDTWKSGWDISIESDVTTGYTYTGDLYSKHANTSDLTTYTPTGTSETIDWSKGEVQEIDLDSASGNVTLTFSNPIEGQEYYLKIIQGSTARNVTFPSSVLEAGGTAPKTLTVTATDNAIDTVKMVYDGTNYLITAINQNYG